MIQIMDKLGGWPVVEGEQWDNELKWNWAWATKQFSKLGLPTDRLFKVSIDNDFYSSTVRLIHVSDCGEKISYFSIEI